MSPSWRPLDQCDCSTGHNAPPAHSYHSLLPPPPPPPPPPPLGFQSDSTGPIVFLSPINNSEFFGNFDYSDYEPVTELTDEQLRAYGFPVVTEEIVATGSGDDEGGYGGYSGPAGVIDSPFIHFTSRESV